MPNINKGLGKGLEVLFGDNMLTGQESGAVMLKTEQIEPSSGQPRKSFDEQALGDLADSIRSYGILQPISVRRLPSGYYQIIAGERRWRAARMAGLSEVPVIIFEADDRRVMEIALVENLQREDLNPVEEASGFRSLITDFGLTQEEAALRVGKSRPAVANALRLLSLPDAVKAHIAEGHLTGGHGRALLSLPEDEAVKAAELVVKDEMSVRDTELLVKKLLQRKTKKPKKQDGINYLEEHEKNLSSRLGRGVRILSGKKKGKIELEFYNPDDLDLLLSALLKL